MPIATRRPLRRALVLATLASTGCPESYPPIPAESRELVGHALDLLACYAEAEPGIWSASSPDGPWDMGEVDPRAAAMCMRDLVDRQQVFGLTDAQFSNKCGLAEGCTQRYDGDTCGRDQIFVPLSLVPETLVDSEGGGIGALASVLHHESIHAMQSDRFGDCNDALEVEAYAQQMRFTAWLGMQLSSIDNGTTPPGMPPAACDNSLDAAAIDPCVREFILAAFPSLDPSTPFPAEPCEDLREIRAALGIRNQEAFDFIGEFRDSAAACITTGGAMGPLRESSPTRPLVTVVLAGSTAFAQYYIEADGSLTLVRFMATELDEILAIRIFRDLAGTEHLLVAGRKDERGQLEVWRDSGSVEFPEDGLFDLASSPIRAPLLMSAADLVAGPDGAPMVWDVYGQRVFQLRDLTDFYGVGGPDGVPDELVPTPILQVPVGPRAYDVAFAVDEPLATTTLDPDPGLSSALLVFHDTDLDGIYELTDQSTALESEWAPPIFLGQPVAGRSMVTVAGAPGHHLDVHEASAEGSLGAPLGSVMLGASGRARVALSRALVEGEHLRNKDHEASLEGPTARVSTSRPVVTHLGPALVASGGGEIVHVAGHGLSWVDDVYVGEHVPFVIDDDEHLRFQAPALWGKTEPVLLLSATEKHVAGTLRSTKNVIRFDDAYEWSAWSSAGGWSCGSGDYGSELPESRDPDACHYAWEKGAWGELYSPPIEVGVFQEGAVIRMAHRPSFGREGDGGVLQALVDGEWVTLRPRGRPLARIDSRACSASACAPDSPAHGMRGWARGRAADVWLFDELEVPAGVDTLELRLVATSYGDAGGDGWSIDRLEIVPDEGGTRQPPPSLPPTLAFDLDCSVVGGSGFACKWLDILGAVGPVIRFAEPDGSAFMKIDLHDVEIGRQVGLRLRHRYDFEEGDAVDGYGGLVELCKGPSCESMAPIDGYPGSVKEAPSFTDRGTEARWIDDVFDVSDCAGQVCVLVLRATTPQKTPEGLVIDAVELEVR